MKRILFVDDEQLVLDGLRALLRPQRSRWDMTFVSGGPEALAVLAAAPCDVIVSDMRMPGMDGAALLREVQQRHPGVVRIVLSGHAEMEAALRIVPVAHQFLVKPCDPDVLENSIERACNLQTLTGSQPVEGLVARLRHLPELPPAYLELTRVLANERSGVADAAQVIDADPALREQVLRLVNSPFVGLSRTFDEIDQAMAYLGTNMLKNMALAVQVFDTGVERTPENLWIHQLQRHSLLVGSIARRMMGDDRRLAEDAFIAGILHDVGKLVFGRARPDEFARLQTSAAADRVPLWRFESAARLATHAELGAYVLNRWGLPYPVIEAVGYHHAPGLVTQRPGVDILTAVYAANIFAHEDARVLDAHGPVCDPLDRTYLQALGAEGQADRWHEIARSQIGASRSAHWAAGDDARAA